MSFDFAAFKSKTAAKNESLLKDLDIKLPTAFVPATPAKRAPSTPKKLKAKKPSIPSSAPPASGGAAVAEREAAGLRSSHRVRNSLLGLTPKKETRVASSGAFDSDDEASEEESYYEHGKKVRTQTRTNNKLGKRTFDPKSFGNIPGVKVGTTFEKREQASTASIHAPFVAGIYGGDKGTYSICVSGGYEGDVDLGERLTFSGAGGRALKGTDAKPENRRTAPQSANQSWETPMNASLRKSVETGKPIRVLRGFKGKSCFAPETGYRYDGLYQAVKWWEDVGEAGFDICRVALVRLGGQGPIPIQAGREHEADGALPGEVAEYDTEASASPVASDSKSPAETPLTSPEPATSPLKKRKRAASTAGDDSVDQAEKLKRRRSTRF